MMRLLSSLALLVAKTWKTWGNSIYHNQPLPSGSNSIQVVVATAPALRQLSSLLLLLLLLLVFFFYSFTSYALCVHGFVLLFTTLQIHVYNRIHIQSGHGPHVEHGWARTHWGLFAAGTAIAMARHKNTWTESWSERKTFTHTSDQRAIEAIHFAPYRARMNIGGTYIHVWLASLFRSQFSLVAVFLLPTYNSYFTGKMKK